MSTRNIYSVDAYKLLKNDKSVMLVDVRTSEEWNRGVVSIDESQVLFLSWRLLPDMSLNRVFQEVFMSRANHKDSTTLFLCRSGVRSFEAAQFISANLGFTNCYNIIDGFEGGGNGNGWKKNNLPWDSVNTERKELNLVERTEYV